MILFLRQIIRRNAKISPKSYSTANEPLNKLEHLKTRSLLKIEGPDAAGFLQGLITNDILFLPPKGYDCLYTMFLNSKGRILSDSIIYKIPDCYLVECDESIAEKFTNHLKMYKLRKQLTIESFSDFKIYALFDQRNIDGLHRPLPLLQSESKVEKAVCLNDHYVFSDPRVASLGYRIITNKSLDDVRDKLRIVDADNSRDFRWLRYNLGVGEGVIDIPPMNSFPLEANVDYLHGINFHKGCYIGQELTARTYHTGVTRKRLMPLILSKKLDAFPENSELKTRNNERLGKLRGLHETVGLALLFFHKVLAGGFKITDVQVETKVPHWWPKEATQKSIVG